MSYIVDEDTGEAIGTAPISSGLEMSVDISQLAAALSLAQGEMDDAAKDSDNPHFKSKYADMSSVRAAYRAPLAKHGLSLTQWPYSINGRLHMTTILAHKSGQWMRATLSLPPASANIQGQIAALTYMRRVAAAAAVGIAPAEIDDDGNTAAGVGPEKTAAPAPKAPPPKANPKDAAEKYAGELIAGMKGKDHINKMSFLAEHGLNFEEGGNLVAKKGTPLDRLQKYTDLYDSVTAAYFEGAPDAGD